MVTNPNQVFKSADWSVRLTRGEIADLMNQGTHKTDIAPFTEDDAKLTDEVCATFVEWYSNTGDAVEATFETVSDFPQLVRRVRG